MENKTMFIIGKKTNAAVLFTVDIGAKFGNRVSIKYFEHAIVSITQKK